MLRRNSHQFGKTLISLAFFAVGLAANTTTPLLAQSSGMWNKTGSMNTARENHTATLLQNGQVLVAGGLNNTGVLASAELYTPSTGTWTYDGSGNNATNQGESVTLLGTGMVLTCGGTQGVYPRKITALSSCDLFDPSTSNLVLTGSMHIARDSHREQYSRTVGSWSLAVRHKTTKVTSSIPAAQNSTRRS